MLIEFAQTWCIIWFFSFEAVNEFPVGFGIFRLKISKFVLCNLFMFCYVFVYCFFVLFTTGNEIFTVMLGFTITCIVIFSRQVIFFTGRSAAWAKPWFIFL